MSPEDLSRTNLRVLRTDGSGIAGMGFVIGRSHMMTCAHVIADALNRKAEGLPEADVAGAAFEVQAPFHRPDPSRRYTVRVVAWRPYQDSNLDLGEPSDIAVLELAGGATWPDAIAAPPVRFGGLRIKEPVISYGFTREAPQGKTVSGAVRGPETGGRGSFSGDSEDARAEGGCSGAALWSVPDGALIGMVAERRLRLDGLFITTDDLLTVWPDLFGLAIAAGNSRAEASRKAAGAPIGARLGRRLHDYDRVDPFADFNEHLRITWEEAAAPTVCLFAGVEADLPFRFRDRCQIAFLAQALNRPADEVADRLAEYDMPELAWPSPLAELARALDGLIAGLRRELGAADPRPETLRGAHNEEAQARIFYSEIRQRDFGARDIDLLGRWALFCQKLGKGGLKAPLVHLICLKLEREPAAPAALPPDERVNQALRRLLRGLDTRRVAPLRVLPCLERDDVERWLARTLKALGEGDATETLKDAARRGLAFDTHPRLDALELWLDGLSLPERP